MRSMSSQNSVTQRMAINIPLFVIEVLALCWPTALNGGAVLVFPDTRSYFVAGHAAWIKAWDMLSLHHGAGPGGSGDADKLDAAIQKARAVRSVFYSLVTYLSGEIWSLWLAVGVQAIVLALLLNLTFSLLRPGRPRWHATLVIVILAFSTTASWVVSNAMPDVFTPIAALCAIFLVLFWDRLSRSYRVALAVTLAVSTVMHLTNPPVVLAIAAVGAALQLGRPFWRHPARYGVVALAVAVSLATTLAVSVVGFKQWTLTPNAPPFLLARSLDDGPGKLYLRQHCPQVGLDMCRHLDRLDVGDDDFIWHQNGVYSSVSLEEAATLRAEDKKIYLAAALEHPLEQFEAIVANTANQLGLFTLREYLIPSYGYANSAAPPDLFTMYIRPSDPLWERLLAIPEYIIVIAALGYLAYLWGSAELTPTDRRFLVLIATAVVVNAAVCAFSIPSPRYEARVIWLIPMAALMIVPPSSRRIR